MECPICDNELEPVTKKCTKTFRGEDFDIWETNYRCKGCQEGMTTTSLDEKNVSQVYNQYRERHGILFPDEIRRLRDAFGLSKTKMSSLLGWGPNTYAQYEAGSVPNPSHSNLLRLVAKNPEQLLDLVRDTHPSGLGDTDQKNILGAIRKIQEYNDFGNSLLREPKSEYTGYVDPDYEKLANMIVFLAENDLMFVVRMNKLLFYTDFTHYRKTGQSISGYRYAAIRMGPVIDGYNQILGELVTDEYIEFEICGWGTEGQPIESMSTLKSFDPNLFSVSELETMKSTEQILRSVPTKDLIKRSHEEKAWIENEARKGLISFQNYAHQINI